MEKRIALLSLCVLVSLFGTWSLAISAPATAPSFTVNSTVDAVDDHPGDGICHTAAGICTLRAAIMEANRTSGATIHVPMGTYTLTIPPGAGGDADGDLNINSPMTISGAVAQPIIASGVAGRVFEVGPDVVAAMNDLFVENGAPPGGLGGGIRNWGSLTLTRVTVQGNTALYGGGIWSSGPLAMTLGAIAGNSAVSGAGLYVQSYVTVTLSQVLIEENVASSYGGGIYNAGALKLYGSSAISNTAQNGGGIYIDGAYADTELFHTELLDTIVISNTATSRGGGLFKASGTSALNLSWAEIKFNTAGAQGGGLYLDGTSAQPDTIRASSIHDNSAFGYGGGAYFTRTTVLMTNSAVYNNTTNSSAANGGGLFNGRILTLTNSTVSGNWGVGYGGGIYNGVNATLGLYNATIAYNVSGAEYGGWGGNESPGGGVANEGGSVLFRNTLLAQNNWEDAFTNLVPNDCWGTLTSQDYNLVQTISNCTIDGSTAHNKTGADPLLAGLGLNYFSGPRTHALLDGSPAIDAGNPSGCIDWQSALLLTDQRYFLRSVDGDNDGKLICDIGSFEYGSVPPTWLYLPLARK